MAETFKPFLSIDASRAGIHMASLINDRSPYGQWIYADRYLEAARALISVQKTAEGHTIPLQPLFFLMTHSAELALKAFLLTTGRSLTDLARPPLNHDLPGLLTEAVTAGLAIEQGAIDTLQTLFGATTGFYFRYGAKDAGSIEQAFSVFVPPIDTCMSATEALVGAVYDVARATEEHV